MGELLPSSSELCFPLAYCKSPRGDIIFAEGNRLLSYDGSNTRVLAGSAEAGFSDGKTNEARFNMIRGLCYSADGNSLYIADCRNHCIRALGNDGNVRTYAGTGLAGSKNGSLATAQFSYPVGLCLSSLGELIIADTGNNLLRRIDHENKEVVVLAGSGRAVNQVGLGQTASLHRPHTLYRNFDNEITFFDSESAREGLYLGSVDLQGLLTLRDASFVACGCNLLDVLSWPQLCSILVVSINKLIEPAGTVYVWNQRDAEVLGTFPPLKHSKSSHGHQLLPDDPSWLAMHSSGFLYSLTMITRFLDTIECALEPSSNGSSLKAVRETLLLDPQENLSLVFYRQARHIMHDLVLNFVFVHPEMTVADFIRSRVELRFVETFCLVYKDELINLNVKMGALISSIWTDALTAPPIFDLVPLVMEARMVDAMRDKTADNEIVLYVTNGCSMNKLRSLLKKHLDPSTNVEIIHKWMPFSASAGEVWNWEVGENLHFSISCCELPKPIEVSLFSSWTWKHAVAHIATLAGLDDPTRFEAVRLNEAGDEVLLKLDNFLVGYKDGPPSTNIALQLRKPITLHCSAARGNNVSVSVLPACPVSELMKVLQSLMQISIEVKAIFARGAQMDAEKRLSDYNIGDGDSVYVVYRFPL